MPVYDKKNILRQMRITMEHERICSMLEFLNLPCTSSTYARLTAKNIKDFMAAVKPGVSLLPVYHNYSKHNLIRLYVLRIRLERLARKILMYPYAYLDKAKINPNFEEIKLPDRIYCLEQSRVGAILRGYEVSNLKTSSELKQLYENFNWLYDQSQIKPLSTATKEKVVYLLNCYLRELQRSVDAEAFTVAKLESIAKHVTHLIYGIQNYPHFYITPLTKAKKIVAWNI